MDLIQNEIQICFKRLLSNSICFIYKFSGKRQRNTPVTDARGIVEIVMLLPGTQTARIWRQAAELMVRYIGGDLSLVGEICAIRDFQEELAAKTPTDPRRILGEVAEARGKPR